VTNLGYVQLASSGNVAVPDLFVGGVDPQVLRFFTRTRESVRITQGAIIAGEIRSARQATARGARLELHLSLRPQRPRQEHDCRGGKRRHRAASEHDCGARGILRQDPVGTPARTLTGCVGVLRDSVYFRTPGLRSCGGAPAESRR